MADGISEHVLKYSTDEQSVARSVQAVSRVKASLGDLSKAARETARPLGALASAVEPSKAIQRAGDLLDRIEALQKEAAAFRREIVKAYDDAADGASAATRETEKLAQAQEKARQQAERDQRERATLYGDVESRTRAITGAVGYVGGEGIERTVNLASEALSSVEAVKLMRLELPQLAANLGTSTAALGGLGAAVVAAGVAFEVLNKVIEQSAQATKAYLNYEEEYWRLRVMATTEEARAALEEEQARRAVLESRRAEIQSILDQAEATDGVVGAGIDVVQFLNDVSDAASGVVDVGNLDFGGMQSLEDELKSIDDELGSTSLFVNRLEADLQAGAFAANDAAAAEAVLADARTRAWQERKEQIATELKGFADIANNRTRDIQRARDWSSEQAQRRLEDIRLEQEALKTQEALIQGNPLFSPTEAQNAIGGLRDAYEALQTEADGLIEMVIPAAEAREAETEAIEANKAALEAAADARQKAIKAEQDAAQGRLDTLEKFLQESIALEAQRTQALLEEQVDFERKRLRDLAGHQQDLAKFDADTARKRLSILDDMAKAAAEADKTRLKALREHQRETERLAEDHQARIQQIQDDAQTGYEEAMRRRDTAGALAAIRQGERAIRDEDRQYTVEKQRREEDFQDKLAELETERQEKLRAGQQALADLAAQHARERAERIAAFQQRLAEEDEDRRIRLARQQAAWDDEDKRRRAHYAAQLGITEEQLDRIYRATRSKMTNTATAFSDALNTMYNQSSELLRKAQAEYDAARRLGLAAGASSYGGYRTPEPLAYAAGGDPPLDQVVKVGERGTEYAVFRDPVTIYTRDQAARMGGGGTTLNFYLGKLGDVSLTAPAGMAARDLAGQAAGELSSVFMEWLESAVQQYAGGA